MNNPLEILRTLDRHLSRPAELTLFGRSALALGFPGAPPEYGSTHDIDGIIPFSSDEPDVNFWVAQQATNAELKGRGLYITHLFSELDIIIEPGWQSRRVALSLSLSKLRTFRPAGVDLILTKMARGDEQDLEDIQFLLRQEPVSAEDLRLAFSRARVPNVPEIRQLFTAAQPKVLKIADEIARG